MSAIIVYFTRCDGSTVELTNTAWEHMSPEHAVDFSYPLQQQFICYSRNHPAISLADLRRMAGSRWLLLIGKCAKCGSVHLADRMIDRTTTPNNHPCDARCTFARGHLCECVCGGRNHGAGQRSASLFDESEVA